LTGVRGTNSGVSLASVTNAPATGIGTRTATLLGNILNASDTPEVLFYYGPTDGGQLPPIGRRESGLGRKLERSAKPLRA